MRGGAGIRYGMPSFIPLAGSRAALRLINQAGIVFEKNLGPDTARLAPKIETFDPDSTWRIAETEHR